MSRSLCLLALHELTLVPAVTASLPWDSEHVKNWLPNNPHSGSVLHDWNYDPFITEDYRDEDIGYAGYCAHPPIQDKTVSSHLTQEEKDFLDGAQLVGLHVIFRHGTRIPTSPLKSCFKVPGYKMNYTCGIQESLHWDTGTHTPLVLESIYPSTTGRCGTGRLQDEAKQQFDGVARSLRKHYDFGHLGINASRAVLRADEQPRTQASMFLLASKLFPQARHMKLHMMPWSIDPWSGGALCPQMMKARDELQAIADYPAMPGPSDHDSFARQWVEVTGTFFHPISVKDCLTQAACTPQDLPFNFSYDLFKWAMNRAIEAQRLKYASKTEVATILSAPVLFELQDTFEDQLAAGGHRRTPPLALYSTHDTTIVELLVGMGMWDGTWPTYAEALVLEAYSQRLENGSKREFFRFLRRGIPMIFPGCGNRSICSAEIFMQLGKPWLRDPDQMSAYCYGEAPPFHDGIVPVSEWLGAARFIDFTAEPPRWCWFLAVAVAFMTSVALGAFIGLRWATSNALPTISTGYVELPM